MCLLRVLLLLLGWIAWQRGVLNVYTIWLFHEVREHLVIIQLLLLESIVISHGSTLIMIENVLRVHHIWLEGMIVVGVLMMCLHLLLHALTQIHNLQLHLLLVLLSIAVIIMWSSRDSSLSMWSLIVTLHLISIVIISIVFVWVRRWRVILAALAVKKSWLTMSSLVARKDHWMWILKIRGTGRLREKHAWVAKCLGLEVGRHRRCQRYWRVVLRLLKCRNWILLGWAIVWTIVTKRLKVTIELVVRQSSESWLHTSWLNVIFVSCGRWYEILKFGLWLWG